MQYRLRTLLILLAIGPPMLAGAWVAWLSYRERQHRRAMQQVQPRIITNADADGVKLPPLNIP
jgi:hypothetical protein